MFYLRYASVACILACAFMDAPDAYAQAGLVKDSDSGGLGGDTSDGGMRSDSGVNAPAAPDPAHMPTVTTVTPGNNKVVIVNSPSSSTPPTPPVTQPPNP